MRIVNGRLREVGDKDVEPSEGKGGSLELEKMATMEGGKEGGRRGPSSSEL